MNKVPHRPIAAVASSLISLLIVLALPARNPGQQGSITLTGSVWLPDGNRAPGVRIRITGANGVNLQIQSDSSGKYEALVPVGRYSVTATNPQDPRQYTDPIEADGPRANVRVFVHIFLRLPGSSSKRESSGNVISVAEASQNVPKDARKEYENGVRQHKKKEHEKALASLDRAIEIYPPYFQALAERGQVRVNMGKIAEAAQDFDTAIELNKGYEPALRGAGFCRLQQQNYLEAIGFLERAIQIDPSIAHSHLFLGIANLVAGRRDAAGVALLEALRLDREQAITAYIYLANLYAIEERYGEAADQLRAYLSARPDAPNAERLKQREAELRARAKTP